MSELEQITVGEFKRLMDIEKRLITAWLQADNDLDTESSLLRCAELRKTKRDCEKYLAYTPKPIEDENTPTE